MSDRRLAVWIAENKTGLLEGSVDGFKYLFAYNHDQIDEGDVVSLTMPVRLESWSSRELHPVFQMNLPEGALLEAIRRAVSKIAGDDDLTMLRVTGGSQIGRNRFSLPDADRPGVTESVESLEELLTYPDTDELFHDLLARYALRSGISGVQPKVLLDASERGTATTGGFIVKSWGTEHPELAANEYFCMTAAKLAGLVVPEFHLSDNRRLFVMKRFDVDPVDGSAIGFEDFCSLQALGTARKYSSSYERSAKTISSFVSGRFLEAARKQFFATLVISSILHNGDAHLKNFGVLYKQAGKDVQLAPVYDLVTTTAYLPKDVPVLSMAGTKKWWPRKVMEHFAATQLSLSTGTTRAIFEQVADGVSDARQQLADFTRDEPEFTEVGERMLATWDKGLTSMSVD